MSARRLRRVPSGSRLAPRSSERRPCDFRHSRRGPGMEFWVRDDSEGDVPEYEVKGQLRRRRWRHRRATASLGFEAGMARCCALCPPPPAGLATPRVFCAVSPCQSSQQVSLPNAHQGRSGATASASRSIAAAPRASTSRDEEPPVRPCRAPALRLSRDQTESLERELHHASDAHAGR
jgi:hypothetical protein